MLYIQNTIQQFHKTKEQGIVDFFFAKFNSKKGEPLIGENNALLEHGPG